MKRMFLVFILIYVTNLGASQPFCEGNIPFFKNVPNCKNIINGQVLAFNLMVNYYELKDTIKYECEDSDLVFSYKKQIISDWEYDPEMCGKKLMIRYGQTSNGFIFLATIPIGKGKAQVYEVVKQGKEGSNIIFKSYKEQGILPYGEYIEKNCSGVTIVKGKYKLTKVPSFYKYNFYDEEKHKRVEKQIENELTSVKSGTWKYYDTEGHLSYEECYKKKKFKSTKPVDELCDILQKKPRINYYRSDENISLAIDIFNAINTHLGRDMVISYDITHRNVIYYLNGKIIPNPFFDMKGKYKSWDYQVRNNNNNLLLELYEKSQLKVYIPKTRQQGEVMIFKEKTYSSPSILDVFETLNYHPNGKYERNNCSGNVFFQGNYYTKDTTLIVKEYKLDTETYSMNWLETSYDYRTVRSGKWSYFDVNGEVALEENYPGNMNWPLSSAYLCTDSFDIAKNMTKKFYNPYMLFNSVCDQFSVDAWIKEDDIFERKQYYFNGELIDTPEDISETNYVGDFGFKTPHSTIEIKANTQSQGVMSNQKVKRALNYSISFDYNNGESQELSYYKNVVKSQDYKDGIKNGLYKEKGCGGNLLTKGQYFVIDTYYIDTTELFDTNTYETTFTIRGYNKIAKKYGVWRYWDTKGILVKEEDYGKSNVD